MDPYETHLELAQRHVAEGEERISHQAALVAKLTRDGHDTAAAELLLSTMTETLLLMRAHLAEEQAAHAQHQLRGR